MVEVERERERERTGEGQVRRNHLNSGENFQNKINCIRQKHFPGGKCTVFALIPLLFRMIL